MKKIKQFLTMFLVIILSCTSLGSSAFASSDLSDDTQKSQISSDSQEIDVEGTDSLGETLATAIAEENKSSEERKQSADNITGLEIENNTAVVEFQTQTEAEIVVAVYDEQQSQMLASGNDYVSQDEDTAEITISGDMPQYFVATAYLLDKDNHEPLCDSYTTELYTKDIQDLRNSTVDDYDSDKVIQLDGDNEETNFAVFNNETIVANENDAKNHLTDNGNGTYTITNADSSFTGLKAGDTFSYNYNDGTVLLVKIADISVDGTTVTVREDTNTDLNDYFDYVKIEASGSEDSWSVDNSNLEEGVTAVDSGTDTETFSAGAARVSGSGELKYSKSYDISKEFDKIKIKSSVTYGFSGEIQFYVTLKYQYFSTKIEYSMGSSIEISGKLSWKKIPLGRITYSPLPCIEVGFCPALVLEASGKLEWSGEIKGTIGGEYDSNYNRIKSISSGPSCKNKLELEGKLFLGIQAAPYISIISEDFCKVTIEYTGGVEVSAALTFWDTGKDEIHICKMCLKGEIKKKFEVKLTIDIIKGLVNKEKKFTGESKIADFYYSKDYNEFGWTTCPHICYPVKVTVKDQTGNTIKGITTLTVTDQSSGEAVKIRIPNDEMDSVEVTDSEPVKIYLPNGSYVIHVSNEKMKGEKKVTIHNKKTEAEVKVSKKIKPSSGTNGSISWNLTEDGTLYIEGQGEMVLEEIDGEYANPPWYSVKEFVKSVIIEEGITNVGCMAFMDCTDLNKVEIPDSVTSIDEDAFSGCINLDNIEIPKSVVRIGGDAFSHCTSLKSIEIPDSVVRIGDGAFYYCTSLKSMEIPESVTDIEGGLFGYCINLSSVKFPENMTSIKAGMFSRCENLRNIEIQNSVTSIESYAFFQCFNLSNIKLPKNLISIGDYAFSECISLSSLEIPNSVVDIGESVFQACRNLDSIVIPENVKTIGRSCFVNFPDKIRSVYFKGNKPDNFVLDAGNLNLYYPRNNSTWDGIEAEYAGRDSIKWIAYDPSSLNTASIGTEAAGSAGINLLENQTETPEFADDINDFESDDPETDISIESDEDVEITSETPDSSNTENATIEETIEDDFGSDDGIVTEIVPPVSNAQDDQAAGSSVMFSNLVPLSRYLFVMIKDENAANLFEASNLLYISQKDADETGTVSFRYILREPYISPVSKVFGEQLKEIANTIITLSETNYTYDGTPKTPEVTVKDGDDLLQNGKDYTVVYSNNVNVGTATVTVNGKGNYTGSASVPFTIQQPAAKPDQKPQQPSQMPDNNHQQSTKTDNIIKASDITKNVSGKVQTVNIKASVNDGAKLTYASNNKMVKVNASGKITIAKKFTGKAVITIIAAETVRYNKTTSQITVTVRPLGTSLSKLTNDAKGKVKVTWKRNKSVTGYRIQYSTDKKFQKAVKTVNIGKNKTTKATLSKLKKGKTYYVRIATYKKSGGKIYSSWSKMKKIKIKK